MKKIKQLISIVSSATYANKVDWALRNYIDIKKVKVSPVIIVFKINVDDIIESRLKRIGMKIKYRLPFINALCGTLPVKSIDSVSGIFEVHKIYFDGTAYLQEAQVEESKSRMGFPDLLKPVSFGGKGLAIGFIDSGIYPHIDFMKPKNRIIAFKDFINGIDHPYDDNGHGTACIGAACGASADGKFKALAYDASIVCAKAFNSVGTGFFSDILAAMQWIYDLKEKYNIKVLVLPFSTNTFTANFDILSRAAAKLWSGGIFITAPAGNAGPTDGSIQSPAVCETVFTVGALSISSSGIRTAFFSSRGPVKGKAEKPDAIMPGVNIETLNADTSYLPQNAKSYPINYPAVPYKKSSGTSIAASIAGGAALLLYGKNSSLSPDDVKNILKKCCASVNELKHVQGAGVISIRKLEDWL